MLLRDKKEAEEKLDEETVEIPEEIEDKQKKKSDKKRMFKIDRDQFEKEVLKHLEPFHKLIDKANGVLDFKEGKSKGVQIIAEKANNKNITRISGIELIVIPKNKVDQQITKLSTILQQKLASSVTIHNLPGRHGGKVIVC